MPQIKLKTRMAGPDGNHSPGSVVTVDADLGQSLVDQGMAEWVTPPRQEPIERAVEHIGGGWFLVGDEKIQGREAAEKAARR